MPLMVVNLSHHLITLDLTTSVPDLTRASLHSSSKVSTICGKRKLNFQEGIGSFLYSINIYDFETSSSHCVMSCTTVLSALGVIGGVRGTWGLLIFFLGVAPMVRPLFFEVQPGLSADCLLIGRTRGVSAGTFSFGEASANKFSSSTFAQRV